MKLFDKKDLGWISTLYGTAVGAGILYLPAEASVRGLLPLIIIAFLAGPIVWLGHKNLTQFCMGSSNASENITDTAVDVFGKKFGSLAVFAYFFSLFPILILFGISLTNTVSEIFTHLFGVVPPRMLSGLVILSLLTIIILKGEKWILAASEIMVIPLIIILAVCTLYFIPSWKMPAHSPMSLGQIFKSTVFLMPLIVFSFNFSPACSAFSQAYRLKYGTKPIGQKKVNNILIVNVLLLLLSVLPFVFSCFFATSFDSAKYAISKDIPILLVITSGKIAWSNYLIQGFTLLAIASSFLGVYMGSHEGAAGLTNFFLKNIFDRQDYKLGRKGHAIIHIITFLACWFSISFNLNVVAIIKYAVSPVLAFILFIMPILAKYKLNKCKPLRTPFLDFITLVVGLLILVSFFLK